MMNAKPLKFEELSQEARDQWKNNGTFDYVERIQCCHNCPNWQCERAIDRNYAWNSCNVTRCRGNDDFIITKFDFWCPDYAGHKTEQNLVWVEQWNEAERIERGSDGVDNGI